MRQIKFKEFITLQRGFDLPKAKRIPGNYPLVASTKVDGSHENFKVNGPGVITGRSGSLGGVQFVEKDFWPLNTTLWVKDFKGNKPKYVYYFLQTLDLAQYNSGAGVPSLNRNHLDEIDISIHKIGEQSGIEEILSNYDNLIENNNRRIAILEDIAQSLYREWFVHFRFPGHQDCQFKDSELGRIPEGWEVRKFGELVHFLRDSVRKGPVEEKTPYMGLEHFPRKSISLSDWELVNEIGSSKLKFEKGDILFGKIRPYFHKVGIAQTNGLCSSDTFVWRPIDKTNLGFVANIAFSDDFVAHSVQTSQGTKMPRANWDVLKKYKVATPNKELLNQYKCLANAAINEIEVLSSKNRNLKVQRDLLLPKLISGQLINE